MTHEIKLGDLLKLYEYKNPSYSPKDIILVESSLQSVSKRLTYANYHFALMNQIAKDPDILKKSLFQDFFNFRGADITHREIYEANFYAFIQSLHACIDTFPWYINKLEGFELKDINVGWKKNFLTKFKYKNYYHALESIFISPEFKQLKTLVNKAKHQYLLPIENNLEKLQLSGFSYELPDSIKNDSEKTIINVPEQNLIQFIINTQTISLCRLSSA